MKELSLDEEEAQEILRVWGHGRKAALPLSGDPDPRPKPKRGKPQGPHVPNGQWEEKAKQYDKLAEQARGHDYDITGDTTIPLETHYRMMADLCRLK